MARTQFETTFRHFRELLEARPLEPLSDAELLERFIGSQDEAAFALLVQRYGRLVWSVCRQILGHEQDTEDAYQASFLVLVRHAASIRRGQSIACWLYRVASRIARKAAMDRAKRQKCESKASRPSTGPGVQDASWRELQAIVQEELARLPEKYQSPFVLCCLDGKSKSEAARQLGWKEGTVSSRLAHARKLLQQKLARRGVTLSAVLCMLELFLKNNTAPASLAKATVKAASWILAGKTASGILSPQVTALMQGVVNMLFLPKIKTTLTFALTVCLVGAGALAWQRSPAESALAAQAQQALANFAEQKKADSEKPQTSAVKTASKSWIGIASRETNAGPELAVLFTDGRRQTINAAADTVLLSYLGDHPWGTHQVLSIDLADTNRILLRFDLPQEGEVQKAELSLMRSQSPHPSPSEPVTLAVHEVKESWDEGKATWNRQPAFARRPAVTARIDPAAREYRMDVTSLIHRAIEARDSYHGWLLRIATPLSVPQSGAVAEGARPQGWACHGSDYDYAVDSSVRHGGKYSCRIQSKSPQPSGFAMMSQAIRADDYRGQRVRFSGYLKTEALEGMASLWMRIDGEKELLAIDKTVQQAIRGTSDWRRPQIVLDVPTSSTSIRFAVLVEGTGKAWVDDLKLEVVDQNVSVTNPSVKDRQPEMPRQPVNLDFEGVEKP